MKNQHVPAVLAGAEHPPQALLGLSILPRPCWGSASSPPSWQGWDLALVSLQQLVTALAFSHSSVFPPGRKLPNLETNPVQEEGEEQLQGALGSVATSQGS